jgi:hypothetical protein
MEGTPTLGMRNFESDEERRPHNPPLHSEKIVTDRKIFFLDLKQNDRGSFIKITEDVRGRRDTIILPMEAAQEFMDAMMRILDVAGGGDGSVEETEEEN